MIRATSIAASLTTMVLVAAVPSALALECGDVDASGSISATDALLLLNKAVAQPAPDLVCPLGIGVPVTGQTTCYGLADGLEIACSGTGQDGELRRGTERSFTDNGDGTVTDNLTGLMWEKNSPDGTIHDNSSGYLWHEAFAKIETLNSTAFAGHSDWRLPNAFELFTLVNLGVLPDGETTFPMTYAVFNSDCTPGCNVTECSCTWSGAYWTSSTVVVSPTHAHIVSFYNGASWVQHKLTLGDVRAVRNVS